MAHAMAVGSSIGLGPRGDTRSPRRRDSAGRRRLQCAEARWRPCVLLPVGLGDAAGGAGLAVQCAGRGAIVVAAQVTQAAAQPREGRRVFRSSRSVPPTAWTATAASSSRSRSGALASNNGAAAGHLARSWSSSASRRASRSATSCSTIGRMPRAPIASASLLARPGDSSNTSPMWVTTRTPGAPRARDGMGKLPRCDRRCNEWRRRGRAAYSSHVGREIGKCVQQRPTVHPPAQRQAHRAARGTAGQ